MSLQLDFGGFDPAFLGVSINFQNLRVRELHKQFSESPTPIPVAQLPDDERFTALSIFSVMAHETRHFHDFFLTSYSAHVFFYRVQMVVNLLQVIPYFRKKGPNCLPVPMLKWCRMDAAGRQDELQWLGPRHDGKPWVPVNLPLLKGTEFVAAGGLAADVDALTPLLVAVLNRRDKIRDLTFNADTVRGQTSFQPWQVFELSALVVQFHEIEAMYGLDAALFWVNHLVGLGNTPYASVLKLVVSLWDDSKEPVDFHLVSAIVWWCLLGSFAVDSWNACPTHRFVHLFKHLKTTGLPSEVRDVLLLFDRWSQRTGLSKVRQGLVEARDRFRATRANLAAQADTLSKTSLGRKNTELLQRMSAGVSLAADHMMAAFLDAPDQYIVPRRYSQSVDQYVNPVVRKVYRGIAVVPSFTEQQLKERGFVVQSAFKHKGKLLVQSLIEPYAVSPHNFYTPKDAMDFEALLQLCDYLVSETDRTSVDIQRVKHIAFTDRQTLPFELIG